MASHFEGGGDDFEEDNPHCYQGGYDIALTYGRPSPLSLHRLLNIPRFQSPPTKESGHRPEPTRRSLCPRIRSPITVIRTITASPVTARRAIGRIWMCSGFWPFASACESLRNGVSNGADVKEVGYWNQWKRAGDYLFGYSQGYGERRIGVDSDGIPIYANKKEWSQPVTFQIEPVRDLKHSFVTMVWGGEISLEILMMHMEGIAMSNPNVFNLAFQAGMAWKPNFL